MTDEATEKQRNYIENMLDRLEADRNFLETTRRFVTETKLTVAEASQIINYLAYLRLSEKTRLLFTDQGWVKAPL